jgi:acetyl esterase/lipase
MYPNARLTEEDRRKCKGVIMHIHGGGWTLGDERSQDTFLEFYADASDMAVVSVGYRLAPENPFPKGPEDCIDAGEYFAKNSEKYGGPLKFIGGEVCCTCFSGQCFLGEFKNANFPKSAGAHLSLITTFHLLKSIPTFTLSGLLLHFGCFDMTELPQHRTLLHAPVIPQKVSSQFLNAFMPGMSLEQKKSPSVSPFYEDLEQFRGRLPSALFTCGTVDPLLDDSVMMGVKWLMAGAEAVLKIYTGAPHGFIAFPHQALKEAGMGLGDTKAYIQERLG